MTTLLAPEVEPAASAADRPCAAPGCHRPVSEAWEPSGRLCPACAIEHALFDHEGRFCIDCALGVGPCGADGHEVDHFRFSRDIARRARGAGVAFR